MLPSVVSVDVRSALLDYLRTTFRLQDRELEDALFRFLQDERTGIFKGSYLDVRLPFRSAGEDWEEDSPLDYRPTRVPYAHQLRAFQRLSSRNQKPQNTLVRTGTGSGKTECFLFPLLDHCRRAQQAGQQGIKECGTNPTSRARGSCRRLAGS